MILSVDIKNSPLFDAWAQRLTSTDLRAAIAVLVGSSHVECLPVDHGYIAPSCPWHYSKNSPISLLATSSRSEWDKRPSSSDVVAKIRALEESWSEQAKRRKRQHGEERPGLSPASKAKRLHHHDVRDTEWKRYPYLSTLNVEKLSRGASSYERNHNIEWKHSIYSSVLNAERLQWQNNIYKYVLSATKEDAYIPNNKETKMPKRERRTVTFKVDQVNHINNEMEDQPERGSSLNQAHDLMHAAMEKSESDRDFKRKSTRNMARELAQLLIGDNNRDECCERISSFDPSHNLMHVALEKAKLDSDFRRASTRSVTRNVAQAIMIKADGDSASREGNHKEAIERYTKAIEIDPGNSSYFVSRSAAYLKTDDNLRALEDANIAIELDLNLTEAHCVKGEALVGLGQYNDAMAAYQEGLDNCPDSFALQVGFDNAKRCRDADRDVKMQAAMDKAESDRDFKRKSTRQMARDLALALIDEDDDYYAQSSSKGPTNSLMQTAMEKAGSDRDFRRDSTRSAARNAAQALLQ